MIFGIAQHGDTYEITGVERPDKIQNDFLVDMASDLVKAMFSDKRAKGTTAPVAGQVAGQVSPEVGRVLEVLQTEMVRLEIQKRLKLKGRANFEERYLKPALQAGFIELTIPDKPRSRLQKYRRTDKGRALVER